MDTNTQSASSSSAAVAPTAADLMTPSQDIKLYKSFDDMGLPDDLLRGVYANGFERPSEIQSKAIVPIREGRDVLAQAQSGTGKTGTFTIGSMCRIDPAIRQVQVLVMVHVRELAQQIRDVAKVFGTYMGKNGIQVYSATGGNRLQDDIRALEHGVQFLVGTPGRIYDLMNRGVLSREHVRVLILDEADQMLEDRFKEQVMCILQMGFPASTQVALFSATMPEEVVEVATKLLRDPVRILREPEEVKLQGISQYYVELQKEEWKYDVLCDLYQQLNISQALIYVNKKQRAEWLAEKMSAQGFPLSFIHGEMPVEERKRRMEDFRKGVVRVMISTDMLARGIDVQQVSLVVNFELPPQRENYVHRIGRCGRYGRKGSAINLICPEEKRAMELIQEHYDMVIQPLPEDLSKVVC